MTARYTTLNGRVISQNRKKGGYAQLMRDPLGNVIATADSAGAKKGDTTYWPYGEVRTGGVSTDTPFGFCGTWGYYTDASGRQYVRARYYRPTLGRWQTVDPLWPRERAYEYCYGDSVGTIDISGLDPKRWKRDCDKNTKEYQASCDRGYKFACCAALVSGFLCELIHISQDTCTNIYDSVGIWFYEPWDLPRHIQCQNNCMIEHFRKKDTDLWKRAARTCNKFGWGSKECCVASVYAEQDGYTLCALECAPYLLAIDYRKRVDFALNKLSCCGVK